MKMLHQWKNAAITGSITAALEAILLFAADPHLSAWILFQSIFFWFACGIVVYLADTGLPPWLHGIVVTVLLNISWYIELSIIPNKLSHLAPLIIASIIFGAILGVVRNRLQQNQRVSS
jgi:hypothetical protein